MQAYPEKLLHLLGGSNVIYKIPVYQRKYEWREEQVDQFFDDLMNIIENDFKHNHFLGTIVFVSREIEHLMRERILIDGQQRITTAMLLMKALMDIMITNNESLQLAEGIKSSYLFNLHAAQDFKLKLIPVESDYQDFKFLMSDQLNRIDRENSRIFTNYNRLKKLITESSYSTKDIHNAMGHLDVVYISLDRGENPQVIFESLNSTGLSLTQADLIRNFILMGLDYEDQTRLYNTYWTRIEEILPYKIISEFVRDYLTVKTSHVPNKNKVYETFKRFYFKNDYSSEDMLIELVDYAKLYEYILNSDTEHEDINVELKNINNIRSTVTYPYILELFYDFYVNNTISKETVVEVLKVIVSYIYRRNICNIPTNALNKIFSTMAKETKKIRENKNLSYLDAVTDFLMSRTGSGIFPRDKEFKNNFINNNMYNKSHRIAQLILYNIEKARHKEVVDMDHLTVEHIMPQTLTPEWSIMLGSNAYETHDMFKNTIGNLTLTNYNSEISNKSFTEKKKIYSDSNIKITREIASAEEWTREIIIQRAEKLFEYVKEIWKLPIDNYQNLNKQRLLPNVAYSILDNVIVTGHRPRTIIFDSEEFNVKTWKEMLIVTSQYLCELDRELFTSFTKKSHFERLLSYDSSDLRDGRFVNNGIYIETHFSAKDIVNYIALLTDEFGISELVYFEVQ